VLEVILDTIFVLGYMVVTRISRLTSFQLVNIRSQSDTGITWIKFEIHSLITLALCFSFILFGVCTKQQWLGLEGFNGDRDDLCYDLFCVGGAFFLTFALIDAVVFLSQPGLLPTAAPLFG